MKTLSEFSKIVVRDINPVRGAYKSVIIIDDSETDRLIFTQMITQTAFAKKILEADSAAVVIEWLSSFGNKPDDTLPSFIFLDLLMPGMNGFEFLNNFGNLPTSIKIMSKIIVFTSVTDIIARKKALQYKSVYDFFNKPLHTEQFIQILKDFKLA